MAPRLPAGALIIAQPVTQQMRLRPGDVVVARRPDRPSLEIIKRIQSIDDAGTLFLVGDNAAVSTDSRAFGPVNRDRIIALVRWRYWPFPPLRP